MNMSRPGTMSTWASLEMIDLRNSKATPFCSSLAHSSGQGVPQRCGSESDHVFVSVQDDVNHRTTITQLLDQHSSTGFHSFNFIQANSTPKYLRSPLSY